MILALSLHQHHVLCQVPVCFLSIPIAVTSATTTSSA